MSDDASHGASAAVEGCGLDEESLAEARHQLTFREESLRAMSERADPAAVEADGSSALMLDVAAHLSWLGADRHGRTSRKRE